MDGQHLIPDECLYWLEAVCGRRTRVDWLDMSTDEFEAGVLRLKGPISHEGKTSGERREPFSTGDQ